MFQKVKRLRNTVGMAEESAQDGDGHVTADEAIGRSQTTLVE